MKTINALLYKRQLEPDDRSPGSNPYIWVAKGLEIHGTGMGSNQNQAIKLLLSDYQDTVKLAKKRKTKIFEEHSLDEFVNAELSKIFLSDKKVKPKIGYIEGSDIRVNFYTPFKK